MAENPLAAWLQETQRPLDGRSPTSTATSTDTETDPPAVPLSSSASATGVPAHDGPAPPVAWPPLEGHDGRRRPLLMALAALAWVLVVVFGVLLVVGGETPAPVQEMSSRPAPPDPRREPRSDAVTPAPPTTDGGGTGADRRDVVGAVAAAAVRGALPDAAAPAYVESAQTVQVTSDGDLRIATVLATVRRAHEGEWGPPRTAWFGVLLDPDGGLPVPVGAPWPLGSPSSPSPRGAGLQFDGDDRLEVARQALSRVGLEGASVTRLRRLRDSSLLLADYTLTGDGPEAQIWLRDGQPMSVAGAPSCGGGASTRESTGTSGGAGPCR